MARGQTAKHSRQGGLVVQPRDLDLFAALAETRVLPVEAIEWLLYPGWRERYTQHYTRLQAGAEEDYYPTPNLYRRLVTLRELHPPLIRRFVRVAEQSSATFNRLPDCYALARAGAELLCSMRQVDLSQLLFENGRKCSLKNLEHSVAIGRFYGALRAQLEYHAGILEAHTEHQARTQGAHTEHQARTLRGWRVDHMLAKHNGERGPNYDRLRVLGYRSPVPVLPDATFVLDGVRYFVEIDRGTSPLDSWRQKLCAYEAYRCSSALRARYGVHNFVVLVVVPSQARLLKIATALVTITKVKDAQPGYRFLLEDAVHPTTIRGNWEQIAGSTWGLRNVAKTLRYLPEQVHLVRRELWPRPS